jgi:hypothetical protein
VLFFHQSNRSWRLPLFDFLSSPMHLQHAKTRLPCGCYFVLQWNSPPCPVKSGRSPVAHLPHNRSPTSPSACACASPSPNSTPIPGCRPVHDIPRSEWLLNFLIALRTALHLNFFHTKAQNPPARISARTARMNENEPCWWW